LSQNHLCSLNAKVSVEGKTTHHHASLQQHRIARGYPGCAGSVWSHRHERIVLEGVYRSGLEHHRWDADHRFGHSGPTD
jgi:hypothetical protein